jgi:hypothetical protein
MSQHSHVHSFIVHYAFMTITFHATYIVLYKFDQYRYQPLQTPYAPQRSDYTLHLYTTEFECRNRTDSRACMT